MGYKKEVIKGVSWISLLRFSTRALTFVRLAILGRLLTPAQFGFFGIASLVLSLLELMTETGINVFLIQNKSHIKEYINSAWAVSISRGIILGLAILIAAPYIAYFFNAPQSYYTIALIAVVPFIRGFINPAIITYQKELLFDKEFKLRSILFAIDVFISIVVGFLTKRAESFVWGQIASACAEVTLSYWLLSLHPKFEFELHKIKHIIQKGWWVTLTVTFAYFADNGDNITVGKLLGSSFLGIYQVAYKFSTLPISEITEVINQVIFPVYSKFSHEKERLWKAFIKITFASSLSAIVLGGLIFIFARPIITVFMGNQWTAAIPAIQVLAIYGIVRTIFGCFSSLFLSVGRQDYVAQMTFCRFVGLAIFVIPFVAHFGMVGAGYAMLISVFIEIPPLLFFTYKIFK